MLDKLAFLFKHGKLGVVTCFNDVPVKEDLLLAHLDLGQLKLDYLYFLTAYLGHGGGFDHSFVLLDNLD